METTPTEAATWPFMQPCGCNLESGFCSTHQPMVAALHDRAYRSGSAAFHECGQLADGFGIPGAEYGDWSAWRDSTPGAIEAMYARLLRLEGKAR
jgi:hypothetical protein